MLRPTTEKDFEDIYTIINDAAIAYKGIIPNDRWHDPYMPKEELRRQLEQGVQFSCYVEASHIIGVMGIQDKTDVNLIRHAYVRTTERKKGIGTLLLQQLISESNKAILIGTWNAATWAISFYEKHGFALVSEEDKDILLRKYWNIPSRQVETSVVLADKKYHEARRFLISAST
jgi:N-acetylglutamate synthase-like GNAT family acetyltransferase